MLYKVKHTLCCFKLFRCYFLILFNMCIHKTCYLNFIKNNFSVAELGFYNKKSNEGSEREREIGRSIYLSTHTHIYICIDIYIYR